MNLVFQGLSQLTLNIGHQHVNQNWVSLSIEPGRHGGYVYFKLATWEGFFLLIVSDDNFYGVTLL